MMGDGCWSVMKGVQKRRPLSIYVEQQKGGVGFSGYEKKRVSKGGGGGTG
jgi:hypothetical protein